jgi:hypothetical protein
MKPTGIVIASVAFLLMGIGGAAAQSFSFFPLSAAVPVDPLKPYDNVTCVADAFGKTRCQIRVETTWDGTKCNARAPNIFFDKPNRKYVLIWIPVDVNQQPDDRFRFCPLLGDGAWLKDTLGSLDEQFDDAWAGDDAGNGTDPTKYKGMACFKRFRMHAENSLSPKQYDYRMVFRHMQSGKPCVVDPFIKNG